MSLLVALSERLYKCFLVPQGSILSPILFLIFVPSSVMLSHLLMFADDTKYLKSINDLSDYRPTIFLEPSLEL